MAALLVSLAVMGILASVAMPVWKQAARREREAELIFRAGQYAHAIEKFKRKYANQYPPDVDMLVRERFLRKKYKDPMTKDGEFRIVTPMELQGLGMQPGANMPGMPGGVQGPRGAGGSSFGTGQSGSPFSGPGSTGQGGSPFSRPSGPTGSQGGGFGSQPGGSSPFGAGQTQNQNLPGGQSSFGVNSPGGRTVQMGPVAAVASKSTEKSIRIFKGRDRYDQWIVTIDDVTRQNMRPQNQQPGQQPGQPGRSGPGSSRPSGSSGFGSGFGSGSNQPSSPFGSGGGSRPTSSPPRP